MYNNGSEGHPLWLGLIEIARTRLLKMNFPAWQLLLKTLSQKFWPRYLGNYNDGIKICRHHTVCIYINTNTHIYIYIYIYIYEI